MNSSRPTNLRTDEMYQLFKRNNQKFIKEKQINRPKLVTKPELIIFQSEKIGNQMFLLVNSTKKLRNKLCHFFFLNNLIWEIEAERTFPNSF